ncbi:MAG: ecdysteroid 22-kinase family protein, partial [Acidimicrobiia bacterium]|nr:ecdysteroid 22-kinase family protein [Acidimicrobiia bacterium]
EHIPQVADELTAGWFTEVLAHTCGPARVCRVERVVIGDGVGFVGEIIRCRLTWDRHDAGLPQSVIVKIPSPHKKNRALAEGLMAYEREIRVYRDIGSDLGLPMPRLYHSAMDPTPAPWLERFIMWLFEVLPLAAINWLVDRFLGLTERSTRRYILVLEDIADARPPVQAQGGSVDDALAALVVLARAHAHAWMNQSLVEANPIVWSIGRGPKVIQAGYVRNRDDFRKRWGSRFSPRLFDRVDEIQDDIPELIAHLAGPPWTVLHGDFRLDNILFRPDGSLVVLDYQGVGYGRPAWDVAYFITTALDAEHRSEEPRLLTAYHRALVAGGVVDYSFDQLSGDIERSKALLVHRVIGGSTLIDTDTHEIDGDETLIDLIMVRTIGWMNLDQPGIDGG